jgi:hypothetical protein
MMIEFQGTKEMTHINFNQINETKTNIQMQLSQNMNTLEETKGMQHTEIMNKMLEIESVEQNTAKSVNSTNEIIQNHTAQIISSIDNNKREVTSELEFIKKGTQKNQRNKF